MTPVPPTSTGSARGRNPAALTATVTGPGTSSAKPNSPCSPVVWLASRSPRTSVTITIASFTGSAFPAARTTPVSPLVPLSRMSYDTGSPLTTIVDACGWKPSAEASRTYEPVPGASTA
ncbi:hypothetical protein GCM10020295_43010 [Streptomyces cinereospinus]